VRIYCDTVKLTQTVKEITIIILYSWEKYKYGMNHKQNKRIKSSNSENAKKKLKNKSAKNSSIYSDFLINAKAEFIVPTNYKKVDKTSLNEDQLRAFNLIEHHILRNDEPLRLCIIGGAGIYH